jgi:hypothetical protein
MASNALSPATCTAAAPTGPSAPDSGPMESLARG